MKYGLDFLNDYKYTDSKHNNITQSSHPPHLSFLPWISALPGQPESAEETGTLVG